MTIDLPNLFRVRAAVGRFGEMDHAGWWNTQGVLGPRGAAVYKRGLPETHFLARVRVVSTVARDRSQAVYPAPQAATLWNLPPALERALSFAEREWATAGDRESWGEFEAALAQPPRDDLLGWLRELGLVDGATAERVPSLPADPGARAVTVPGPVTDEAVRLLAAAHARGASRNLVVPFIPEALGDGRG